MKEQINRRDFFLRSFLWAGIGLLGAIGTWVFGAMWTSTGKFSTARWVPVIPLDQLPQESIVPFPEHKVAILRRGPKVGAISLECTHLGCIVNVVDRGFFCPCHGSDFGPLGQVYSGPAIRPLPWHEIMFRRDWVWVQRGGKYDGPRWAELKSQPAGNGLGGQ
ncbi:MAG: ubiquinol-cytochrome c reductase iron-sulfur subunit [Deltaproteobacteria bacterium]|nr:ubiquinol-cytochrome c reductase iron-sulfur subunit [Deltaproteobacteria bacterium]